MIGLRPIRSDRGAYNGAENASASIKADSWGEVSVDRQKGSRPTAAEDQTATDFSGTPKPLIISLIYGTVTALQRSEKPCDLHITA